MTRMEKLNVSMENIHKIPDGYESFTSETYGYENLPPMKKAANY